MRRFKCLRDVPQALNSTQRVTVEPEEVLGFLRTLQIEPHRQTDRQTGRQASVYQSVGGDDSRGERVGR